MSEEELEIKKAKEAKKAIRAIIEYCGRLKSCNNCYEAIRNWCYNSVPGQPCDWKVQFKEEKSDGKYSENKSR